jgi:hypothetical protein
VNAGQVYQIALTVGVALATALAAGWFNKPKVRGEGRQAEGAGELSVAAATSERFAEYRRATDATITSLTEQCTSCTVRLGKAEERIRGLEAAVRATVRAVDKNDPAQIEAAITAARELI